ncbi:MAG: M28 family peptidase [Bacteroidetes bacterium]|nr:M28 family peptidase [Bacteroidota bacterium]
MKKSLTIKAYLIIAILLLSCADNTKKETQHSKPDQISASSIPDFNADSAYYFVEKQVSFGPRVPNTVAHQKCADWLISKLTDFADTVHVQQAKVRAYDGKILNISNIIGSFNPQHRSRIILCAHWDSRPYADYDPNPANHYTPIDGANDGASGVGVLIEIARILSLNNAPVGIDIILFDAEDYGKHENFKGQADDSWALGSQYWSKNPHISNYYAKYGILLDMVGASNATFKIEEYSYYFAPGIVRKVWETAQRIGYGNYFSNERGSYILDDHYYMNTIRGIPTINIIHQETRHGHGFFKQWHTIDDNMDVIDKETLKAVGQTVITVVFENK